MNLPRECGQGAEHFLTIGVLEARCAPAAHFEDFYPQSNPDMAGTVGPGKAFMSGMQHFIL